MPSRLGAPRGLAAAGREDIQRGGYLKGWPQPGRSPRYTRTATTYECMVGSACCLCRSPPTLFLVLPRKSLLAHIVHDLFGQIAAELLHVAAGRPADSCTSLCIRFMRRLMMRASKVWSCSAVGARTAWNTGRPSVVW